MTGYVHVKDTCKVWLGNLASETTEESLAEWLGGVGFGHLAIPPRIVLRG